jgi:hypothetical protein
MVVASLRGEFDQPGQARQRKERIMKIARRRLTHVASSFAFIVLLAAAAGAQPFGQVLNLPSAGNPYVQIPSSPSLTPNAAITIEFLSHSSGNAGCQTLIGKGFTTSYWIGNCSGTLRSYLAGAGSSRDGGQILSTENTHHIAVTYDGAHRKHYIDGELVGVFNQTGLLPVTSNPLRLGSDVDWNNHSPNGYLDEVRLWSVARTQSQIRANLNQRITSPQPGLVSVWHLDGNGNDAIGSNDGAPPVGGASYDPYLSPGGSCSPSATVACFRSGRFLVAGSWQTFSTPAADGHVTPSTHGVASVVPGASDTSALFWFFSADNWEVLTKNVNGCGLNNRFWVFSAATTNVHWRVYTIDLSTGDQRIYWNFSGPPAPATTDTSAFATCP